MINDKDCMHSDKILNSAPMVYIMKGNSLPTDDLHFIVDNCHKELHKCNIPILCEIYDGQWRNIVNYDSSGQPMNRLQLAKQTWDRIGKLSKDKIIEDLSNCSKLFAGDKDLMMVTHRFKIGITTLCNIEIHKHSTGAISIACLGGSIYSRSIMPYIHMIENDDMWTSPHLFAKEQIIRGKKQCKAIGLQPTESSIIDLLDANAATLVELTLQYADPLDDDCLPDLQIDLQLRITESELSLVQDIVIELQNTSEDKWCDLTTDRCYTEILRNGKNMMKTCTLKDIQYISRVMELHTAQQ